MRHSFHCCAVAKLMRLLENDKKRDSIARRWLTCQRCSNETSKSWGGKLKARKKVKTSKATNLEDFTKSRRKPLLLTMFDVLDIFHALIPNKNESLCKILLS